MQTATSIIQSLAALDQAGVVLVAGIDDQLGCDPEAGRLGCLLELLLHLHISHTNVALSHLYKHAAHNQSTNTCGTA